MSTTNFSPDQSDFDPESSQKVVPVLTLSKTVLLPILKLPIPLRVSKDSTVQAIKQADDGDGLIFIVTQRDPDIENPEPEDLYSYGIVARIIGLFYDSDDESYQLLIEGVRRARMVDVLETDPFLLVEVEYVEDEIDEDDAELAALIEQMRELALKVIELSPRLSNRVAMVVEETTDPAVLGDLIVSQTTMSLEQKQEVLETQNLKARLKMITKHLGHEIAVLEMWSEIQSDVLESLEQHQKEAYLREQMRAIQKHLGEDEEEGEGGLKERIAEAKMPEAAEKAALREVKRMNRMNQQSAEFTVARNYIDWLLDIPWSKRSEDRLELKEAKALLNEEHYGLEKVKRRMIEFLAVCKLKGEMKGPILCLVGPPGVGKTSLGHSIAKALGREFIRISLGGVRDEAEIRGHRRTYIGSLPGRFIKALKKAGTMNPVICLDEIDKLGQDFRGDPGSALLEVLDPEQNQSFSDHYLEVPVDLSQVLFLTTANRLDTIPPALKDRLEILEIPGYIQEEKLQILQTHLLPRVLDDHGLTEDQITIQPEALEVMIEQYTREAGVRTLKRQLASVIRSVAHDLVLDEIETPVLIDYDRVRHALGPQKVFPESGQKMDTPGVSIGLAWTPVGGEILFIEATLMKGNASLTLTGQLGEVMKESAHTALSLIHARADQFEIDEKLFSERKIHLHLPSGAIPKDGPSAGVAIAVALTSLFIDRPMRDGLAMTGEITLRGRVLPVGGIKEKVIAAARAGMKDVILPKQNKGDLEEIPDHLRESINFHLIEHVEEALELALEIPNKRNA